MKIGIIYSLDRWTPKSKQIRLHIGEYDEKQAAVDAMNKHYAGSKVKLPQHYDISEAERHMVGGVEMLCTPLTRESMSRTERYFPINGVLERK